MPEQNVAEVFFMLEKLNYILYIVIGSLIGVFIGQSLYDFWDYRARPGLYAMQSAPWYTGIFVRGIFTIAVLIVAVIIKLVVRSRLKKQ